MRDDTGAPDLSRALGLAAGIFSSAQGDASVPPASPTPVMQTSPAPLPSNAELADRLAEMMAEKGHSPVAASDRASAAAETEPPPASTSALSGLDSLAAVLPPLLQALSGNGDLVKPEKLNLVRAFQPYLSSQRSPGIDRAIRMANVALAAKSALSVLGR